MTRVDLRPRLGDLASYEDQYASLQEELARRGFEPVLQRPIERRGVDDVALDLAIRVLGELEDQAFGVLAGIVLAKLTGLVRIGARRGERRRAVIYGPDGRVVREIELDPGGGGPEG